MLACTGDRRADMLTSVLGVVLVAVLAAASTVCVGALFHGAFLVTRTGRERTRTHDGDWAVVRWSAMAWAVAAALLVFVDAAAALHVPLAALTRPQTLVRGVFGNGLPLAWAVVALLAAFIGAVALRSKAWQALVGLLIIAFAALVAPPLASHVLIGPDHDFGGDATILAVPAVTVLIGVIVVLAARVRRGDIPTARTLRRFRATGAWCWAIAAAGQLVVCWFELAGTAPWASATGWLFLVQFAVLAAMAAVAAPAFAHARRPDSERLLGHRPRLMLLVALSAVYVAADVARARVTPPQYFVPTTIMQKFFGYTVTTPPTWAALALDWRPSILFIAVAVAAVGLYLVGVVRLRRRGDRWTPGRTVAWVAGWAVIVVTTSSGLGMHANATFSAQMGLHMSLNMFGPVLLVLGGPITLALRAATAHPAAEPAGMHEWVSALLNWDVARTAYSPLWVFIRFVGSYYLLYMTPLFDQAVRYHWARDAMNVEFILAGYMFFGLVIGVDHTPRPLPHIGRLGLTMAAMPIHAFFGVIVMMSGTIIAGDFYRLIQAPLLTTLRGDQGIAGGIAWSAGEVPLAFVVIVLALQWARQDEREARRTDRSMAAGLDDSFDAYNEMLAKLAARDEAAVTRDRTMGSTS